MLCRNRSSGLPPTPHGDERSCRGSDRSQQEDTVSFVGSLLPSTELGGYMREQPKRYNRWPPDLPELTPA